VTYCLCDSVVATAIIAILLYPSAPATELDPFFRQPEVAKLFSTQPSEQLRISYDIPLQKGDGQIPLVLQQVIEIFITVIETLRDPQSADQVKVKPLVDLARSILSRAISPSKLPALTRMFSHFPLVNGRTANLAELS
jgi:hypothetical protein